jgi:hypothetical protein
MSVRKPGSKSGGHRRGGKMGAPAGEPADPADLRVLARDAALTALKRLSALSQSEDERVALAATQELLNRAFGKPSASGADDSAAARPVVVKIVRFGEIGPASTQVGKRP